jgi:hypothetical protein
MYLINSMFMPEKDKSLMVLINDILAYSKSMEEEHGEHFYSVLQQL